MHYVYYFLHEELAKHFNTGSAVGAYRTNSKYYIHDRCLSIQYVTMHYVYYFIHEELVKHSNTGSAVGAYRTDILYTIAYSIC